MGQIDFVKGEDLTPQLVFDTFKVINTKKVNRVLEQPTKFVLIYDDEGFRGSNRDIVILPNYLFVESYKKIVYSDYIEIKLEYFTHLLGLIKKTYSHIHDFIVSEDIKSVKIKPSFNISNTKDVKRIEIGMIEVKTMQDYLLDPKNAVSLDIFILAELIRKFYVGETDQYDGFLIQKPIMKYIKALLDEDLNAEYIINKVNDNPEIVDNNNFFKGVDDKRYFVVFKNEILKTTKKSLHVDSIDLKYLSALSVIGEVLNDKRFGRRD
jgi:hypothetical protein